MKPNIIFVLGPPGSGKGTQSNLIVKNFNFAHLSAGELLREELKIASSPHRTVIKTNIDAGTIVPVEITCALIKKRMDEICSTGIKNFLIDGFPRNWDNVNGWEREMEKLVNLICVLHFDAPDNVCVERCLTRCDDRTDDNMECLKRRIETYTKDTVPIINYFLEKGVVQKVNAFKTPSEVFQEIEQILASNMLASDLVSTEK